MKMKIVGVLINLFLLFGGFFTQAQNKNSVSAGEDFSSFTEDGAWCWFSDPRAVYYEGKYTRSYVGSVNSKGDITIGYYDHTTNKKKEHVVFPKFQRDDHVCPSILFLPDGRLMLFFTRHNGGLYYTRSKNSEDITKWEEVKHMDMGRMLCYTNPVMLSEENNRIYVFSRGGYNWKPSFVYSDDLGKSWSKPEVVVGKPEAPNLNRPYTKVISDGKKRIYFAFTDGHPRVEPLNSIYCMYYEGGAYYQVDGTLIAKSNELPINQHKVNKAYDGTKTTVRSWIWDVAIDSKGYPVLAYTRLNEETNHQYYYARWNGEEWENHKVANGGQDFPRKNRMKEERNPEPHYSGGIILDHENPSIVYLSRPVKDTFEIFKYQTKDGGKKWIHKAVTSGSAKDNVRPYVTRNAPANLKPRLYWMQNHMYEHYTNYRSTIKMK